MENFCKTKTQSVIKKIFFFFLIFVARLYLFILLFVKIKRQTKKDWIYLYLILDSNVSIKPTSIPMDILGLFHEQFYHTTTTINP